MAPDAASTIDWIVSKFRTKVKATVPRPDGFTAKELTSKFRGDLYHAVMCHVAEGMGKMIALAGSPSSSTCNVL